MAETKETETTPNLGVKIKFNKILTTKAIIEANMEYPVFREIPIPIAVVSDSI